jgi:hypothetical protein
MGLALAAALAAAARAQPFGTWMTSSPGFPVSHGYVRVPPRPALNSTRAFTFEAWVAISNGTVGEDCRSIAGKNWTKAWWIGQCNDASGQPTLRSYLRREGPPGRNGGIIPRGVWTHVAVVFDRARRLHYVNGELAAEFPEAGRLTTSGDEVRIGSDVQWPRSPNGAIDEVRLWNVARTQAQIREWINRRITTAQPGLVAVWALDGTPKDSFHRHDGAAMGTGLGVGSFAALPGCAGLAGPEALCLHNRFLVTAQWRANPVPGTPPDSSARVGGSSPSSGVFWFLAADDWEVLVKAIDACVAPYNRYWIFSATTAGVFYRLEVLDLRGEQKIYFNYPGPPPPAVTDFNAFATCP